ncbi:MAG: hypothetical protein ONB37_19140 [candidate division KSB1 bacterium]|nr:hypothetical protein [candidate division KSB1 bacterium]
MTSTNSSLTEYRTADQEILTSIFMMNDNREILKEQYGFDTIAAREQAIDFSKATLVLKEIVALKKHSYLINQILA